MGVIDDLHPLKPFMKLGFQVIAVLVFLFLTPPAVLPFHGTGFWPGELVLFIWLLGITNALNLLDNMDGLTAGVGAVAALGLAFVGLGPQYVLFPLAGALVGFLVFNHSPAKIYLGDSGSHLVGFSLATLPLFGLPQSQSWIPVVVLVVPIIDTTFVTVTRLMRGVSPFRGGKDHISHRLVEKGWSKSQVAWMVYAVTGLPLRTG
jgi:UDP-GlcNAc:undecaprenyl-phosphate GlcNAc-1-phosphate transferase